MGRSLALVLGAGLVVALSATPAAAQVHVDVGVRTSSVGARVVLGAPQVYVVDRDDDDRDYRRDRRSRHDDNRWWSKRDREYDKDLWEARREYEKKRDEAEREYEKKRHEAEREYQKDLREARRGR